MLLQTDIAWGIASIEADRQLLSRFLNRPAEGTALLFSERHWLFDENVLARAQRLEGLGCMVLVAAHDNDDLHGRVVQDLTVIRRAVFRSKTQRVALGARAAAGLDCAQAHTWSFLKIRQVNPACQIACSNQRDADL